MYGEIATGATAHRKIFSHGPKVFGGIEGKLDALRVECAKCDRKGRYSVARLIAKDGRKANVSAWVSELRGDCPKRDGRLTDRCDLIYPDLSKVL